MTRRLFWLLSACCCLLLARGLRPAAACGGPDHGDFAALGPIATTVYELGHPNQWASWGNGRGDELRFLHPFRLDQPASTKTLWAFAHEWKDDVPAPPVDALDAAEDRHDDPAAKVEAKKIVEAIYAMPPVPAAHHRALMARAVDVIDGTSPSPARLAHEALRKDFRQTVPDGWAQGIRKQVAATTWTRLLADHEAWLAKHPQHPLADQVRLDEVRIHYFAGDADAAWKLLMGLSKRRPTRALAEMRYLLIQNELPSEGVVATIKDERLLSALAPRLAAKKRLSNARWADWWRRAETARAAKKPWAINFEERLLYVAAERPGPLPTGFPTRAQAPTALWAKLRAAALARAGSFAAAETQVLQAPPDPVQAQLLAQIRLRRGHVQAAAAVQQLAEDARRYLVRVRSTDGMVKKLSHEPGPVAADARLEWAQRLVAAGHWNSAAKLIEKDDASRADLWRRAATITAPGNDDAKLALARFLVTHRDSIFDGHRNGFYRGLSWRHQDQRLPLAEREAIERYLTRSSADWLALGLFTVWLQAHPQHADAPQVLKEADAAYNRLVNRGGWDQYFWGKWANQHPTVATLRRVGKVVRSTI